METTVGLKKEFKGTKGKWFLSETDGSYKYLSGDWWDRFARVVVRLDGNKNNYPEGMANARLIAAAPELLEALQNLIDANKGNGKSVMREIENAEKAIEKALL